MKLTKTALYKLVLIVAVLAAVLEFFFAHPHYHEWWNTTPVSYTHLTLPTT